MCLRAYVLVHGFRRIYNRRHFSLDEIETSGKLLLIVLIRRELADTGRSLLRCYNEKEHTSTVPCNCNLSANKLILLGRCITDIFVLNHASLAAANWSVAHIVTVTPRVLSQGRASRRTSPRKSTVHARVS